MELCARDLRCTHWVLSEGAASCTLRGGRPDSGTAVRPSSHHLRCLPVSASCNAAVGPISVDGKSVMLFWGRSPTTETAEMPCFARGFPEPFELGHLEPGGAVTWEPTDVIIPRRWDVARDEAPMSVHAIERSLTSNSSSLPFEISAGQILYVGCNLVFLTADDRTRECGSAYSATWTLGQFVPAGDSDNGGVPIKAGADIRTRGILKGDVLYGDGPYIYQSQLNRDIEAGRSAEQQAKDGWWCRTQQSRSPAEHDASDDSTTYTLRDAKEQCDKLGWYLCRSITCSRSEHTDTKGSVSIMHTRPQTCTGVKCDGEHDGPCECDPCAECFNNHRDPPYLEGYRIHLRSNNCTIRSIDDTDDEWTMPTSSGNVNTFGEISSTVDVYTRCRSASKDRPAGPMLAFAGGSDSSQDCAGDHGTRTGSPVCCGQPGTIGSENYVCPARTPICTGFVQNSRWGTCGPVDTQKQNGPFGGSTDVVVTSEVQSAAGTGTDRDKPFDFISLASTETLILRSVNAD